MPSQSLKEAQTAALTLIKRGTTAADIAKKVGVHPSTVQRWVKKAGYQLEYPYNRHKQRTDLVDKDEILRLRARQHKGKPLFTLNEIAEMCECSVSYVKKVLSQAKEQEQ